MTTTGWVGEGPDGAPAVPVTGFAGFLGSMRGGPEDKPDPLARAMHAPEPRDPEPRDPDEIAANLITRGYVPGMVSDLSMRLQETEALLAAEEAKIANTAQRDERARRMIERGQLGGLDIAGRMASDDIADEGDPGKAARLSRRADSLRRQLAEAQAMIAPPQARAADPYEAANRTAHELFREVTRERMAAAMAPRAPEPSPFGSGGVAARAETVNGSAVAVAERLGLGDDVQRDAHGERIQCGWSPLPGGGYEHHPHGGQCLASGGNTYQRYGS